MTRTLKPYPRMKDSGVEWLGLVPEHWSLPRMKTALRERSQKGFPDEPMLAATQSKGVVRKEEFENRTVLALKDLHLLKLVCVDDFVISLRSFQGGIEYARERGIISPAYTILYPRNPEVQRFLSILFKSKPFIQNLGSYVTGIRQGQNIDYEKLSRSRLLLPPLPEQTAIVKYLNHVDRKVRRFIRAKRKLIALLEEQKRVIIHNAVTRGLDPNVPMKDSGVEWLGEVPEHWEVAALRLKYHQCLGKMLDSKRIAGTHLTPYLRNTDVQWDYINVTGLPFMDITPSEYPRYTVHKGDLLVCEGGEIGRAAIWSGQLAVCGFQKALHRLRPMNPNSQVPRFMFYALRAACDRNAFSDGHVSTIAHLTGDKLRSHRFAFPSVSEQVLIVSYLDNAISHVNLTINRTQREIELLNEYRTRLISDVVTGKLDVREAAAGLPDEVEMEEEEPEEIGMEEGDEPEEEPAEFLEDDV